MIAGAGSIDASISSGNSTIQGIVSGGGGISKSGGGTLVLTNADNNFTGTGIIKEGVVKATSAGALGTTSWNIRQAGTIFVDATQWDAYKSKINSISQGTIGLSGQINNVSSVNMNGLYSMSLGAVGTATLGTKGTSDTLQGWTYDGGYSFSGSSGELTVNAKLSGNGALTIGGNDKNGIVILTGDNSGYTGEITVNSGSGIVMSGTNMIRQISSSSYGTLLVRGNAGDTYDFSGKSNLRFGTDTTANYSGQLQGGTYIFGGTGTMKLSSAISGNVTIESGTHVWVNTHNNATGTISIRKDGTLQIGEGVEGGSIGSGNVNIESGGKLVFNSDSDMIINTNISGYGSINKDGAGTTILTNTNEELKINIKNGALQLGNGDTSGSIGRNTQIDLYNKGAFVINRSDDITLSQYIHEVDGTAKVIKKGAGRLTIENSRNNYTGGTFVQQGTLAFATKEAAGTNVVILEGGCFDMNGMALTNSVHFDKVGSSLQNAANYAGTLTFNTNMGMSGKLGSGSASIVISNEHTLTWNNSLDWFESNTIVLDSLTNNGKLTFDFSGTSFSINSEKSWKLMETSRSSFGQYDWLKGSVSIAKGYAAGFSDVNGVLSFVVKKSSFIDQNGDVIGNYTPTVGDITDVNNVSSGATFNVQNGVNASIEGNIDGMVSIGAGGSATLSNTTISGSLYVNGGAIQADAGKTVSIGTSSYFYIQDTSDFGIDIVGISADRQTATVSNGFKASTESDSSVAIAGSYDHAKIEFLKDDSTIQVAAGEVLSLSKTSKIGNASGIRGTSIQVRGTMNNNSSNKVGTNVTVKSGGLLTGSGIYGSTVSVEGGGTFKIGNSPGVTSVNNLDFSGGTGTGTLGFSINGDLVATTGGWTDNGYSQLTISGQFIIQNAINFNLEIGKNYFNGLISKQGQTATADYVLLLFNNTASLNLGGTAYTLLDAEGIQAWFDNYASWSFESTDTMALADGSGVSFDKFTYAYDQESKTGSLTATLKYGSGAAVPEPSAALLLLAGGAGFLIRRKRRETA